MRYYIGKTIDGIELVPDKFLAIDSGEHRFAIPLDHEERPAPEAAHLLIPDTNAVGGYQWWIW